MVKPCDKVTVTAYRHRTSSRVAGTNPTGFSEGRLLQVDVQPRVNSGVLSLYLVSDVECVIFMIKMLVTLNESQLARAALVYLRQLRCQV